jgi:uroporphyrin-III C-methyltransferase/precorrin-2 dehydrogenase/sirohydrochlorin ferrochelatase
MGFLPLFFNTGSGVVMLVGSGPPALSKLRLLRASGAYVRWFAGSGGAAAKSSVAAAGHGAVERTRAAPVPADLDNVSVVISAAGDPLDGVLSNWARARRLPVNVVDRPELSTFTFPAIIARGEVVVAVGTGGMSPVLARRIRRQIEAMLPSRLGDLAALMGRHRARVAATKPRHSARRFWETFIASPVAELVLAGAGAEAEHQLIAALDAGREGPSAPLGTVLLVGAGPGDPDLLTLRALHALAAADVIFYDELVTPGILERARREAERVFVGTRAGRQGVGQDVINRRLAAAAAAGQLTVRLKGGDYLVFGRGGEELEYLRAHNIPVAVVPGITAALGGAAEAGLPLTLRREATRYCW